MKYLKRFDESMISENLQYHIQNNISVTENIFRYGSDYYFELLKECRNLFDKGDIELFDTDKELFEGSDIGRFGYFEGELVPLDLMKENPHGLDLATPSICFYVADVPAEHQRLNANGIKTTDVAKLGDKDNFAFCDNEDRWFAVLEDK